MSQKYSQKTQLEILREVVEHGEYCMSEIDLTDTVRKWNYDWLVGEGCINSRVIKSPSSMKKQFSGAIGSPIFG